MACGAADKRIARHDSFIRCLFAATLFTVSSRLQSLFALLAPSRLRISKLRDERLPGAQPIGGLLRAPVQPVGHGDVALLLGIEVAQRPVLRSGLAQPLRTAELIALLPVSHLP